MKVLGYFPTPYENELFYSVIARYHVHSGNLKFVDTIRDLYGKTQLKAVPDLATNLNSLCENLKLFNYLSQEELLEKHTMYFYYTNFTDLKIRDQTKQIIFYESNLSKAYRILGILSNKIKEPKFFRFCNKCLKEDLENYGENYWHLLHQLPSAFCCYKHPNEILIDSEIWYRKGSRTEFKAVSVTEVLTESSDEMKLIQKNKFVLKRITQESIKLATQRYDWDLENIYEVYRAMLNSKGYLSAKGLVNQTKLGEDLLKYYGKELLEYLNCELKIGDNNCWLRLITSKHRSIFHPLKHILLMVFLDKGLEDIEKMKGQSYAPFGQGQYPCLNPAAEHYKNLCIDEVIIERDRNGGGRIKGTFKCQLCGFSYSRIGPDKDEKDKFQYSKVREFGQVWFHKLKTLKEDGFSNKEIAKCLNVSVHTIWKYLNGFKRKENQNVSNQKIQMLKQRWLELVKQNPTYSQNQIRNLDKGLYSSLYAIDSEWLKNNSPKSSVYSEGNRRVDWILRDTEYLVKVKEAIEKIDNASPPQRITLNRVETEANLNGLKQKLIKLPNTSDYLSGKLESKEEFQLRRAKWAVEELKSEGEIVTYSKVITKANVYGASTTVLDEIKNFLEMDF